MNKVYSLICMYTAKLNKNSTESWTAGSTFLVQYASDDGVVISSDLVGMIQSWLLNSSCGCIAIGGSTFQLIRGCCSSQVSTVHMQWCRYKYLLPPKGRTIIGSHCSRDHCRVCGRSPSYHLHRSMCHSLSGKAACTCIPQPCLRWGWRWSQGWS